MPALCLALQGEGASVELWTQDETVIPPAGLSTRKVLPGALASELAKVKQAHPQTVIHDHGMWLPWNHKVAQAAASAKVPRVVSPRGMLDPWAMKYRAWKKRIAWALYQKRDLQSAQLLHATAKQEAEHFLARELAPEVFISPNGVHLPPAGLERKSKPEQLRTMLFLSRLHPKKGLLDLVQAWAAIRDPEWQIRIVGPDEKGHRAEVQAAISAAGLTSQISIDPAMAGGAKWQAYADADLFVLPSYSENFGLAIAEALACGTPVVTTQATPWEELETEHCGWWVPTGAASLEGALRDAIAQPMDELVAMGKRGRELIETRYTWPTIAVSMLRAYRGLV